MKYRSSFISNSSSSSFVIGREHLTPEEDQKIYSLLKQYQCDEDTNINFATLFFFGKISEHSEFFGEFDKLNINKNYYSFQ